MKRRVLSSALALAGILGTSLLVSCTTTAVSSRDGNSYRDRIAAKPKTQRLTSGARVNPRLLSQSTGRNTRLVVDIADQRAYLLVNGNIAVDSPVSTARAGKYTPRGSFSVSQRVRTGKVSTIYGVEMPYWMRLSGSVFGVHAGHLPGYPASAGCIRLPAKAAQVIYDNTSYGTRVNVYSSWDGA